MINLPQLETTSRLNDPLVLGLEPFPREDQNGEKRLDVQWTVQYSWLGWVLIAATRKGILTLSLGDTAEALVTQIHHHYPHAQFQESNSNNHDNHALYPIQVGKWSVALGQHSTSQPRRGFTHHLTHNPKFEDWIESIMALLETPQPSPNLPLDIQGTPFQKQVWQALQTIPPGSTVSYGAIAEHIGHPNAVRAVARACAANPLAVIIPCHRVIGKDGLLRGYRWGIDRKRALLEREAALMTGGTETKSVVSLLKTSET